MGDAPTLTLGPWTVLTLETGTLRLDGGAKLGSVSKPTWNQVHAADERNRIMLAMRHLRRGPLFSHTVVVLKK